jgi:hypothetical protein
MSDFRDLVYKIIGLKKEYFKNQGQLQDAEIVFDFFANTEYELKNKVIERFEKLRKSRGMLRKNFNTKEEFLQYVNKLELEELDLLTNEYNKKLGPYDDAIDDLTYKTNKYFLEMGRLKQIIKNSFETRYFLPFLLPCLYNKKKIQGTCFICQENYSEDHPADVLVVCGCKGGRYMNFDCLWDSITRNMKILECDMCRKNITDIKPACNALFFKSKKTLKTKKSKSLKTKKSKSMKTKKSKSMKTKKSKSLKTNKFKSLKRKKSKC